MQLYEIDCDDMSVTCELCGIRCCKNPFDDDELREARDEAAGNDWLFNYDGKQEYAICPVCQERNE